MSLTEWIEIAAFFAVLAIATPLLGTYISRVFSADGSPRWLLRGERIFMSMLGIRAHGEMTWHRYALSLGVFSGISIIVLMAIQMFQSHLPLSGNAGGDVSFLLALNTAISFVTNTNWQAYSGEYAMSIFTQMAGLAVQNFLSAGVGIAVAVALWRGLRSSGAAGIGNFWSDIFRAVAGILLPISFILAIALCSQGVVQSFSSDSVTSVYDGSQQVVPMGAAASQVAIKQLGTNGGGYYGVNSAHPLENPTPLSNFLQVISILLLPSSLVYAFGKSIGRVREGVIILSVMGLFLAAGVGISLLSEYGYAGYAMEGKEQRIGITGSVLWSVVTTAASNGSVNAMHDSLSPISGLVAIANMMTGEVIFGGVGSGLYGMLMYVLLAVFIAALMVGRAPEYLGKKVELAEMKMVVTALILPSAVILAGVALSCVVEAGHSTLTNTGHHGFSEIVYAWTSAAANNGSAFAGLGADTPYYNIGLGMAMLVGRFGVIVPVLCIAGSMAAKRPAAAGEGTLPTASALFGVMLAAVVVIVGGLTFLPTLVLGPVAEQLTFHLF